MRQFELKIDIVKSISQAILNKGNVYFDKIRTFALFDSVCFFCSIE
jgi:hypothetical protein